MSEDTSGSIRNRRVDCILLYDQQQISGRNLRAGFH